MAIYTVLQKYANTGLKQNLLKSITLDVITRLLDNAAFFFIHVGGGGEDFLKISRKYVGREVEGFTFTLNG